MIDSKQMETILSIENRLESIEVFEFLEELTPEQKKGYLLFINGVKFGKLLKSYKEEEIKQKGSVMKINKNDKSSKQIDMFGYLGDKSNLITEAQ